MCTFFFLSFVSIWMKMTSRCQEITLYILVAALHLNKFDSIRFLILFRVVFFLPVVFFCAQFSVERLNNHISLVRVSINYISKSTVHSVRFGNEPHTLVQKPRSNQQNIILMFGSFIFDVGAFARLLKKCAYFRWRYVIPSFFP